MLLNPKTEEAYRLLHDGVLALSHAEEAGIRVDMPYIKREYYKLSKRIDDLEEEFKETRLYKHWEHSSKRKVNINSDAQLRAFLYSVKKLTPPKYTESGLGSTDEETLTKLNIPELLNLIEIKKLKKTRDYLDNFAREQVDGYIHPNFNLHLVKTFRSCIAKGTLILVMHDSIDNPKGIPIENVKEGNYVYCFDDNLNPAIRKVLWAGKTGFKKVIRLHWSTKGKKGFLDVTPEHKIRLMDGSYVEAKYLIGDYRLNDDSKHIPKIRVLSCSRHKDCLKFTGHNLNGHGIKEHRFIYSQLIGNLEDNEIVHHKNNNHLDHTLSNLKKMTPSLHSKHHVKTTLFSPKARLNNVIAIRKGWKEGKYKVKTGFDHPCSLKLSKFSCYRLLAEVKGHLTKIKYDFVTFKKYLKIYEIDFNDIMIRYDKWGNYIWKKDLINLSKLGRSIVSKRIGHNYYRLLQLYRMYGIPTERKWENQFGSFVPNNHVITKVEWINKYTDVYDLEIEDFNNFFANEICVHNSASNPNLQNVPNRDEEQMTICRGALYPRPGHQFLEIDFKAIEVAISCCYHKDSNMIRYVKNKASDMHSDMAKQIFMVDTIDKSNPAHVTMRQSAKNGFVFPQFYGDYYVNCMENICGWMKLPSGKWTAHQGIELDTAMFTISDHLIAKGINSSKAFERHLKEVEDDFWNVRFADYNDWKNRWWRVYQKYGYIDLLTGFRCSGIMDMKNCINYPIQGCLQSDSKILTDKGLIPIINLLGKECKVWTGFNWANATAINKGEYQLAEIELESGLLIKCDTRHKLKNELNEWVNFDNLKIGDYVALPKTNDIISPSKEINWFFIYGFIVGDGYLALRKSSEKSRKDRKILSITVGLKKKEILIKIKEFLESQNYKPHYRELHFDDGKYSNKYLLYIEKDISEYLEHKGFVFGSNAHNKEIPHIIWNASDQEKRDFLEGLWMSDGARTKWQERNLHMCNKKLLNQIQILSSSIGFDSYLSRTKNGWLLRFSWREKNKKPVRKIPISTIRKALGNNKLRSHYKNCDEIVELKNLKSGKDISQFVAERIIQRTNSGFEIYRYDKIKSISILDKVEDTYTMSVDDNLHQFVADGVITKNSAFHCLLWSFIETDKWCIKEKLDSRLVGQIHDSMLMDVHPDELEYVKETVRKITCELLPDHWKWIVVPLEISVTEYPVDGSWASKE
ncbi:MAG: HNH endonuclease [Bacteroidales bacterium]|nr:HNH endonuclease [Bacteroidales bacterium]